MKILFVSNAYPCEKQPHTVAWMRNITASLEQQGNSIEKCVIEGIARSRVARLWQYLGFFARLSVTRLEQYDLIYVHYPSHSFIPLTFRRWRRAKLAVHLHGSDFMGGSRFPILSRLWRALTLKACRRADLIVVPSNYFAEQIREALDTENHFCVYPSGGVETLRFSPANGGSERARDRMGCGRGDTLHVGYVGRLDRGKSVDVLLHALKTLEQPFCATIVGGGREQPRLEDLAEELQLNAAVEFTGPKPAEEVVSHLRKYDVFVFPTSLKESLGLAAIEAMACGVPVIGSRIGALPEYIEDGKNGFLFEPGDAEQLAECVRRFAALSAEQRAAMRHAARQTALRYDTVAAGEELSRRFQQLIAQDDSAAAE